MKKSVSATNVKVSNYISEDLVFSILSKLPLKSLKRFGCVHKSWAFLFENLHFMTMYRNYFLCNNHSYYDGTSILLKLTNDPLPGDAFYDTLYILSGERFENKVKLDWPPPFHDDDRFIDFLSQTSVNGILCLAKNCVAKCVFWNPTTDEFKVIPSSPFLSQLSQSRYVDPMVYFSGFGYDHVRDDYKVLQYVVYIGDDCYSVAPPGPYWEIYSLRSNRWKKLYVDMQQRYLTSEGSMVYLNGVCHWWGNTYLMGEQTGTFVVSFNLANEVPVTTLFPFDSHDLDWFERHLTMLNGFVAMIVTYAKTSPSFHISISILGEPGVNESWTKLFDVGPVSGIKHSIGPGKKGDIFLRKDDSELACLDLTTGVIENIGVKADRFRSQTVVYNKNITPIRGIRN